MFVLPLPSQSGSTTLPVLNGHGIRKPTGRISPRSVCGVACATPASVGPNRRKHWPSCTVPAWLIPNFDPAAPLPSGSVSVIEPCVQGSVMSVPLPLMPS